MLKYTLLLFFIGLIWFSLCKQKCQFMKQLLFPFLIPIRLFISHGYVDFKLFDDQQPWGFNKWILIPHSGHRIILFICFTYSSKWIIIALYDIVHIHSNNNDF
jgi:hypothetical protein